MSGNTRIPSNIIAAGRASLSDGNDNDLSTVGTMGTTATEDDSDSLIFDSSNPSASDGLVVLPAPPSAPAYKKPSDFYPDDFDYQFTANKKKSKAMETIDQIRADAAEAAGEQHLSAMSIYTLAAKYTTDTQKFMAAQQRDLLKLSRQSNAHQLKTKEQTTQISSLKKRTSELEKENKQKKTLADDLLFQKCEHLQEKLSDKTKELDRVTKEKKEIQTNHDKAQKAMDNEMKRRVGIEEKQTEAKAAELKKAERELAKVEKLNDALAKRLETELGKVSKLERQKDYFELKAKSGGGVSQKRKTETTLEEFVTKRQINAALEVEKHQKKLDANRLDAQKKAEATGLNRTQQLHSWRLHCICWVEDLPLALAAWLGQVAGYCRHLEAWGGKGNSRCIQWLSISSSSNYSSSSSRLFKCTQGCICSSSRMEMYNILQHTKACVTNINSSNRIWDKVSSDTSPTTAPGSCSNTSPATGNINCITISATMDSNSNTLSNTLSNTISNTISNTLSNVSSSSRSLRMTMQAMVEKFTPRLRFLCSPMIIIHATFHMMRMNILMMTTQGMGNIDLTDWIRLF